MLIQIPNFAGLVPRNNAELLPDNAATYAMNCNFNSGAVTGLRESSIYDKVVFASKAIKSGFVWNYVKDDGSASYWLAWAWPYDTNAIRAPMQRDKHRRFYWTGNNAGTTEFMFHSVTTEPNSGEVLGEPTTKYRVGVISNSYNEATGTYSSWDYKLITPERNDNGVALPTLADGKGICTNIEPRANSGLPFNFDASGFVAYAVGPDGDLTKAKQLVVNTDYTLGEDTTSVNRFGDAERWTFTLLNQDSIKGYAKVGNYSCYKAKMTIAGVQAQGDGYDVVVWYTSSPATPEFVVVVNGLTGYPSVTTTVTDSEGNVTTTASTFSNGSQVTVTLNGANVTTAGLYFKGSHLYLSSLVGVVVPDPLIVASKTTSVDTPDLQLAFTFNAVSNGVNYTGTYYEDSKLDKPIVINDREVRATLENPITATTPTTVYNRKVYNFTLSAKIDLPLETRAYIATIVNQLGEESAPSDPVEITINPGKEVAAITIKANDFLAARWPSLFPSGQYAFHGFRFYRTATSSTGDSEFLYAFTVRSSAAALLPGDVYLDVIITQPPATTQTMWHQQTEPNSPITTGGQLWTIYDTVETAALGAACPTQKHVRDTSELQSLQGLISINNGMSAAFKNNEVWISEPYQMAFRSDGIKTLPNKVVSLVALEAGFVALTDGSPFYFSGQTPEQIQPQKIPGEFPCSNKNAATVVAGAVVYISPDGPVMINGMQAVLDTKTWSREAWRDEYGTRTGEIALVNYGHRLIAYFPDSTGGGYMFDADDGNWTEFDEKIVYAMRLPANSFDYKFDQLAYSNGDNINAKWRVFGDKQATGKFWWRSKVFNAPSPINLGAIQLFGAGQVWFDIIGERGLKYQSDPITLTPYIGTTVRLPAGYRSSKWQFEVRGGDPVAIDGYGTVNSSVTRINIATNIAEFKSV